MASLGLRCVWAQMTGTHHAAIISYMIWQWHRTLVKERTLHDSKFENCMWFFMIFRGWVINRWQWCLVLVTWCMGHSCPELWYDLRLGWKVADFTIAYHSEFFRFLRLNSWPHNLGWHPTVNLASRVTVSFALFCYKMHSKPSWITSRTSWQWRDTRALNMRPHEDFCCNPVSTPIGNMTEHDHLKKYRKKSCKSQSS